MGLDAHRMVDADACALRIGSEELRAGEKKLQSGADVMERDNPMRPA